MQAKQAFTDLRKILTNVQLSMKTWKRLLKCYIIPIAKYGNEAWTMNHKAVTIMNAAAIWFLKRIFISYTNGIAVKEVLTRAVVEIRFLYKKILLGQTNFFGHHKERRVRTSCINWEFNW